MLVEVWGLKPANMCCFPCPCSVTVSLRDDAEPCWRQFQQRLQLSHSPFWSPETEYHYSFRAYLTDVSLWVMLTDLHPHQQCAAIVMRLGGAAREMARATTPHEIMNGGAIAGGPPLDPVSYLLSQLYGHFSALDEESRLTSMAEMFAFHRRNGKISMPC